MTGLVEPPLECMHTKCYFVSVIDAKLKYHNLSFCTGKGLSVLSGRDLFNYKRDLFKDDETAEAVIDKEDPGDLVEEQIKEVAEKVQSDLFLDGDDDDLDDLDDLDDE
jgi:hypothetical protein